MQNSIEARVEFSYQGVDYNYATRLDLDQLLRQFDTWPEVHLILAKQHRVDTYSYLYEVMQEAEIKFSEPRGYAENYLTDGNFDHSTLANNWQTEKALLLLQPIVSQELRIADLNQHPALKRALLAAYNLGKNS